MKRRIICEGMALALICTLGLTSACGNKGGGTGSSDSSKLTDEDKDCIYTLGESLVASDDNSYIGYFTVGNGSVYCLKTSYSNDGTALYKVKSSSEVEEVPLGENTDGFEVRGIAVDDKENLYIYEEFYGAYEERYDGELYEEDADSEEGTLLEGGEIEAPSSTTEVETEAVEDSDKSDKPPVEAVADVAEAESEEDISTEEGAESAEGTEEGAETSEDGEEPAEPSDVSEEDAKNRIRKLDSTGKEVWSTDIVPEDENGMLYNMVWVKDYGLLTSSEKGFCKYSDEDGTGKFLFTRSKGSDDYKTRNLFVTRDGKVYLSEPDNDWNTCLYLYDTKTEQFGDKISMPTGDEYISDFYLGSLYDVYYRTNDCIKGFDIGDDTVHKVCDMTLSDMSFDYIEYVAGIDEKTLFIFGNIPDEGSALQIATKADPSTIVDKQIITVGVTYIDDVVRKAVLNFNKTSNEYRIKIKNYSDNATEDTDSDTLMNLAISSGDVPDVMVLNTSLPYESYLEKGLFEPLDSYLENDENISADDILPNVLEAGKRNDKLYIIIPFYYVQTCFGSKAMLGDDIVTWQNYKEICERNNIDPTMMFGEYYRDSAYTLFSSAYDTFVDWEKGTCNFKDPNFIEFIEYIKSLPAEPGEDAYSEYATVYREKKALLLNYWLSNFNDYQLVEKGYFGEDVVINGYPGQDGGHSYLQPSIQLAVSAKSPYKDACWDFVSSFLNKDVQDKIEYNLPARKDTMDKITQEAKEPPYYIDENGEKQINYSTWGIGDGIDVEMKELSSEDADNIRAFFESVNQLPHYDQQLDNIMQEELPSFYEGQKTAEEVADIIQSRVSIYLSESR